MKRAFLVLLVLLVAGSFVFAADKTIEERVAALEKAVAGANMAASVSGSATATFGIDLDTKATGITQTFASKIGMTLIPKSTLNNGGAIGWVELKDFKVIVDSSAWAIAAGSVTAKLLFNPMYIQIYGVCDDAVNKASSSAAAGENRVSSSVMSATSGLALKNDSFAPVAGIGFGAKFDKLVDLLLTVESEADWTANTTNEYAVSLSADLKAVTDLAFGVKANMGVNKPTGETNPIGIGLATNYKVAIDDTTAIYPFAKFDAVNGTAFDFEVYGGLAISLAKGTKAKISNGVLGDGYNGFAVSGGYWSVASASNAYVKASFQDETLAGLIPGVGFGFDFELVNLMAGTMDAGVIVAADYDATQLRPYFAATVKNLMTTMSMVMSVGTDIKVIDKVTFNLDWTSKNLMATTPELGIVKFATTISY